MTSWNNFFGPISENQSVTHIQPYFEIRFGIRHLLSLLQQFPCLPESALPEYSFVIPSHLVPSVLQGIHSSHFAGHLGLKKALCAQKTVFFWPMIKSDISHFLRSCPDGAQNKLDSSRNTAPPPAAHPS